MNNVDELWKSVVKISATKKGISEKALYALINFPTVVCHLMNNFDNALLRDAIIFTASVSKFVTDFAFSEV